MNDQPHTQNYAANRLPHVVVVGGGFGGIETVRGLKNSPVRITLIDKTNHNLFQPLLYQVAVAALSPGDIATPFRGILRDQRNVRFLMDEVVSVDRAQQQVQLNENGALNYDYLVLSPGGGPSYFGNDAWQDRAPGLKTVADALDIREKVLYSFEKASQITDPVQRQKYLNFVIVGGGPTGVEMAGAIAEIGRKTMTADFPHLDPNEISVYLLEGGDRLLADYAPELTDRARRDLEEMGVSVHLNAFVSDVQEDCVAASNNLQIPTYNTIWAAGNRASPMLDSLGAEQTDSGQVKVDTDLSLPDDERVFVLGDAAHALDQNGQPFPGVAQFAMQGGKYAASVIRQGAPKTWRKPFVYFDKGKMATIGRARAVAQIGPLKLSGFLAWLLWSGVHVAFLINFRSRIRVMAEWLWYYLTFRPGARILYNRRHSKSGAYSAFSARRQPVSREQVASDVTKVSEN